MTHHHTHESTRAALAHIPANLPRDEWARVGMAIKSEFPDDGGFDLFSEWSASVPGFKVNECRAAWKSFKAGGSVTMGTLLHMAKQHGYTLPKDGQAAAKPSPEVLAQRQRDQAEAQTREAEPQRQRHEAAAAALCSTGFAMPDAPNHGDVFAAATVVKAFFDTAYQMVKDAGGHQRWHQSGRAQAAATLASACATVFAAQLAERQRKPKKSAP
jgi:Primase C terminal 2 (PriCT-2)